MSIINIDSKPHSSLIGEKQSMSVCVLFMVLLCLCPLSSGQPNGTKCEGVEGAPTCVCKTPHGVIDLTKIASFDGTPR